MAFDFNELEPEIQQGAYDLFLAASEARLNPRLTSARRTAHQQFRLWKNYLSGNAAFPALPPGLSPHEYGIAFDMITSPFESLGDVGATWEDWGGEWGGGRDPIHFQIPDARGYILDHLHADGIATAVDFAIGFLPVIGQLSTAAAILQLFPQWSHNAILEALSSPAESLLGRVR